MIDLDPVLLARIQFAFTVSFHIIFPAFTIGLASFLAVTEWLWLRTKKNVYLDIYNLWVKIFAVAFGMGVVSGVVMSYQFGTNWSIFSDMSSNVIGPLLGFEVLTAFFLEASFLGIMLFGWGRVSERMHFFATAIVAIGTLISAFWILSANSWMQTPQGFITGPDGRLQAENWLHVIFNPSFPYRLVHMVIAAYLTTAFVIGGTAAFYFLKKRHFQQAKVMIAMSTLMAAIVAPTQLFVGDLHGQNTFHHQPVKLAAIEGIWETESGAALRLFGWPDQKEEVTKYSIEIPKLASIIITHETDGTIRGLKEWPAEDRPPVAIVFWSFRIMVGIGLLMIAIGLVSAHAYFRKTLYTSSWLHKWWLMMAPSGFIALLAGWFVTEIGRQPYVVYGVIRTKDVASPSLLGPEILFSLLAFVIMYSIVFGAGIYYIFKLIRIGIVASKKADPLYNKNMKAALLETITERGK